jgi:hypothetical protein
VDIIENSFYTTATRQTSETLVNPNWIIGTYDPGRTLYAGAGEKNNYVHQPQITVALAKPSVTDDGSCLPCGEIDRNIYRKDLRTSDAPNQLSDNGSFRNVAISKDGKDCRSLPKRISLCIYLI